jgi:hypothetical protein
MAGSYERRQWKQTLHDRLAVQAATIDPGPAGLTIVLTTGPGRSLCARCAVPGIWQLRGVREIAVGAAAGLGAGLRISASRGGRDVVVVVIAGCG